MNLLLFRGVLMWLEEKGESIFMAKNSCHMAEYNLKRMFIWKKELTAIYCRQLWAKWTTTFV